MPHTTANVYQFKVTLAETKPPIWRRIQVPDSYTFWDLHVAIQDAMGWMDSHLHEFQMPSRTGRKALTIGIPDDEGFSDDLDAGWEVRIRDCFTLKNAQARYVYDFGDNWVHKVVLENILPADPESNYPVCIAGRRACPPEDCGGPWGYQEFLEAMSDPNHPEHEDLSEWIGGSFDPDAFDPKTVVFANPEARWKIAFEEDWLTS